MRTKKPSDRDQVIAQFNKHGSPGEHANEVDRFSV